MKAVLDVDGVMHPMMETVCKLSGIELSKVDKYNINECKQLKDFEKKTILEFFKDIDVFKYGWKEHTTREIRALKAIMKLADVFVNSISWTEEITEFKREKLYREFNFVPKENIILNTVKRGAEKEALVCDVIIEDCYENIKRAQAESAKEGIETTGILVSHIYNRDCTMMRMLSEGILIASDFYEALMTAERVLQMKSKADDKTCESVIPLFNAYRK